MYVNLEVDSVKGQLMMKTRLATTNDVREIENVRQLAWPNEAIGSKKISSSDVVGQKNFSTGAECPALGLRNLVCERLWLPSRWPGLEIQAFVRS